MKFLGTVLLLGGYALVYAAVAAGGKFATEPWMGFITDAYSAGTVSGPTPPTPAFRPPVVPRTQPITFPIF